MANLTGATPVNEAEFVAFDTETTGLSPVIARLVELSGVKFRLGGEVVGTYSSLIDPEAEIPPEATAVHGITAEMVSGQPTSRQVLSEFIDWAGSSSKVVLAAHNAPFDLGFLEVGFCRADIEVPEFPVIDTLSLSRKLVPSSPNHQLQTLVEHLGFESGSFHRALADSHHVRNLLLKLLQLAPKAQTWADVSRMTTVHRITDLSKVARKMLEGAPADYDAIREAITSGSVVNLVYEGSRSSSSRLVTPRSVHTWRGTVYLTAFCHTAQEERTFRLDKIQSFQTVTSAV